MALAKAMGVPPSFVSKMINGEKPIPADRCRFILDFTDGAVTIPEMREDFAKYWPELGKVSANTAQTATEAVASN